RIEDSDKCTWCGHGVVDNAQHVLVDCPRFESQRLQLERSTGTTISVASLVPLMLKGQDEWDAVCVFAEIVMKTLRTLERRRNAV
ncbi:hypothetical protein KR222_007591, partial [Zaprionus bogoriensis]